jgi:glycosyltransferase involved in cell wall biosynthesis
VRFRLVVKNERAVAFAGMRNVQVIDSISDQELLREYQSADLLVVPYLDVVASNTVLEGLSCGLPVVTTDVGAMGDYVTSDCGHMVRRGDGAEMAEAILALIGDGQQRRKMGAHGRQVALKYDWRDVAAAHVDLYRNLAA